MKELVSRKVNPHNLIYANPVKQTSHIEFAKKNGISKMTFDCVDELYKIKEVYPAADCVLRITTKATNAIYHLAEKYGASMADVPELLALAKKLGLRVKGVSFHVGTGGVIADAYICSLVDTRNVFNMAVKMGLEKMDLVDIGGGFSNIHHG